MKFKVQYNHIVFKPDSYALYKQQKEWSVEITEPTLQDAKQTLIKEHNLNPFYFSFTEI